MVCKNKFVLQEMAYSQAKSRNWAHKNFSFSVFKLRQPGPFHFIGGGEEDFLAVYCAARTSEFQSFFS